MTATEAEITALTPADLVQLYIARLGAGVTVALAELAFDLVDLFSQGETEATDHELVAEVTGMIEQVLPGLVENGYVAREGSIIRRLMNA